MYEKKAGIYFDNSRTDLLNMIPEKNRHGALLEIGAGTGTTLLDARKNGFAQKVYGVELFEIENSSQTSPVFEEFILGNIEKIDLPFPEAHFDVILCGDVLEHLIDPQKVLVKLKKHLKDDGIFLASIPNIREWGTMKTIFFKGDFHYVDSGILDKTHLRFFTKKNMLNLFTESGFTVQTIIGTNKAARNTRKAFSRYFFNLKWLRLFFALFMSEFSHVQFLIVAQKKN